MGNDSTSPAEKSRIQDGLRNLLLLAKLLENEGIRIVTAEASINRQTYILFSGGYDLFRTWCRKYILEPKVIPYDDPFVDGLNWRIQTEYHGVEIHSYMTDREKEAYDAAEEA